MTPTLINNITGALHVHDLVYPRPVDHLSARVKMVEPSPDVDIGRGKFPAE